MMILEAIDIVAGFATLAVLTYWTLLGILWLVDEMKGE